MRPFVLAVLCLGLTAAVSAQLRVTDTEFDPPDFVPGDKVSLLARFDPAGLSWDDTRVTAGFPDPGDAGPTVLSAAIERRAGTPVLVVQFIPWMTGRGQLPALYVGGLAFPAIPFEATSSLGTDLSPPLARPQLEPPGLRIRAYIASGLLLAIAVGILVFLSVVLPWFRRLMARWTFIRIRREFDARLALLDGDSGAPADAWALLCSSLRWFLEARTSLPWLSMTPSESAAVQEPSMGPELVAETSDLLLQGDAVRFAGSQDADLPAGLSSARSIAERLDQALAPARHTARGGRK